MAAMVALPSFRTACSGLDWRRVAKLTAAAWRRAGASYSAHGCTKINRAYWPRITRRTERPAGSRHRT